MRWFRPETRSARIERLRAERAQLAAELDAARNEAAWLGLSDELIEQSDSGQWVRHVRALQNALDRLDRKLLRLELDELSNP